MTHFLPYPKIAERMADWFGADDTAAERWMQRRDRLTWVATEKVHGANLCIVVDSPREPGSARGRVRVARRRDWLTADENFFDYRGAVGPLLGAAREVYARVVASTAESTAPRSICIHGELFGGDYPHAAPGPRASRAEVLPVQTGVAYCPDVRFAAFDVAVIDESGERSFLPYADAEAHLLAAGFMVVPKLGVGSLHSLLSLPVEFETRIPRALKLPPVADNWAEGLVIKPWDAAPQLDGKYERPLLKRKHPAFEEARYHASQAWSVSAPADALARAEAAALALLTVERVKSAQSKIGRSDANGIRLELVRDLRDTLEERHGAWLLALAEDETALLWSVVEDAAAKLVMSVLRPPLLDPERYHVELLLAFIRGHGVDATPLELIARADGLPLHKFKRKSGPPRVTRVLAELAGLAPQSLLDIGCGRGAFLWPLVQRFSSLPVTAVDRLPHRVRDVEAVRAGGVERLRGCVADVVALPFEDAAFDVVTILEVLEHLEDPAPAAREVLRVAQRTVIASVPSKEDDNPGHLRLFSQRDLERLFMEAGATRVRVQHVRNHMIAVVS